MGTTAMRDRTWLAIALACGVAACRIPDETFTPIGGGDGGAGGADGAPDGAMHVAMRHGWAVDRSTGLHHALKNAAGDLSGAGMFAVSAGPSPELALTDRAGTRIYVFNANPGGTIFSFPVTDGVLGSPVTYTTPCTPSHVALHPSGDHIAIGCQGPDFWVADIAPNGDLANFRRGGTPTTGPTYVAFDPSGSCLLLADGGAPTGTRVYGFVFDTTGPPSQASVTTASTNPRAIAAHPTLSTFYVGGAGVQAYSVTSACVVSAIGAVLGGDSGATDAAIDPLGRRLFLTASAVYVYEIDATGRISIAIGSPFFGAPFEAATFDPAVPDVVYLTTTSNLVPATTSGPLAARPAVMFTDGQNLRDLVFTP